MQRPASLDKFEIRLTQWAARWSLLLLRLSLGVVFFWFGVLKFFPGLSPAEDLAGRTIEAMTFGVVPPSVSLPVLALWECLIGLGFLTGLFRRTTLLLLFLQMPGTMTPLLIFPHETFIAFPYAPTLEGQYILKNLTLIAAGLVLLAVVRGGGLVADSGEARRRKRRPEA